MPTCPAHIRVDDTKRKAWFRDVYEKRRDEGRLPPRRNSHSIPIKPETRQKLEEYCAKARVPVAEMTEALVKSALDRAGA